MATFKQQLEKQQELQRQSRATRTERLREQYKKEEYERLKAKASELSRGLWQPIQTAEGIREFTNEDYQAFYEGLSPELKQFFVTRSQLETQQQSWRSQQKQNIQLEVTNAQSRLAQLKLEFDQDIEHTRESWRNQSDKYRSNPKNKERYRERLANIEDDYNEDRVYYQGYIQKLGWGMGEIDAGKMYDFNAIKEFADDYGRAERQQERADAKQEAYNRKQLQAGLTPIYYSKNTSQIAGFLSKDAELPTYLKTKLDTGKLTRGDIEYYQGLQTWSSKTGYSNLPTFAKKVINPSAQQFQADFPNEKLVYDKSGNVTGVESAVFGQTLSVAQYNAKVQEQQKRYDLLSKQDTTLNLGKQKEDTSAVMSAEIKPFTEEQIRLNEYYSNKSYLQKGFDWVKSTYKDIFNIKDQTGTPELKYETKYDVQMVAGEYGMTTNPSGTWQKQTVKVTKELTPESKLYVEQTGKFEQDANKLADEIFADYQKKIETLQSEDITAENISKIKKGEQEKFSLGMTGFKDTFEKNYTLGMKDISRQKKIGTWGELAKGYYVLEDKDLAGKRAVIPSEEEMTKHALKDFTYYREKGMPVWLSKELSGGEEFGKGAYYGTYKAVYENPRTIALKTGAMAGLVAGGTVIATYSGGSASPVAVKTIGVAGKILTGMWAGSVLVRTAMAEGNYQRGLVVGEITGKEVLPIIAGGYLGRTVAVKGIKTYETWKTMRQNPEWIASYKRVRMEVLKGEQRFPTAKASKHVSEFKKAKYSLLTDEKDILQRDFVAGSHATTSGRFAKVGERYTAGAGTSEYPVQYYSSEDSLYFALGKGQKSSLYRGSLISGSVPKPYVEAYRSIGIVKMPKTFKPSMTKAELISFLKVNYPDYPLSHVLKGDNWKKASFMIERGRTGELVAILEKSEIEAGKLAGTVAERTAQTPYYTRVLPQEVYKDLTEVRRLGRTEYVWQVKPLQFKDVYEIKTKTFKPMNFAKALDVSFVNKLVKKLQFSVKYPAVNPILKFRVTDILYGRQIGQFKPMKFGEVVPIERYVPIPETVLEKEQHIKSIQKIKETVAKQLQGRSPALQKAEVDILKENILTKRIKEIEDVNMVSLTSGTLPKSSITYGEEYAGFISYPKGTSKISTPSFSKSYSVLVSKIRSLTTSGESGGSSGGSSFPRSFSGGSSFSSPISRKPYDYINEGFSYTPPSRSRSYLPPLTRMDFGMKGLKQKIQRMSKPQAEIKALMPDFTARSIGLAPMKVKSVKEAIKEINRLQSGFEVRTGISMQGYSPIDEKSLLRGIMK